jgi:flagellar hook-associated protein 1 FlgK
MSLTSLLSIARTALLTQQKAIDTTGHNVANASTEGFSRQRLVVTPEVPQRTGIGQLGRGVTAQGIERIRSQFLDASFRRENGELGSFRSTSDLLGQVERIFGEPSDTGLAAGIDALFSAFGDLTNDPTSQSARSVVRQAAITLTQNFQATDRRLNEVGADVTARIQDGVTSVNQIASQIAELNTQIQGSSAGQREAPDLKDQRDKLVDQLSSLVSVRVLQRDDGTIGVAAGDTLLVDGGQAGSLETRDLGNGRFGVGLVGSKAAFNPASGELAALITLSRTTLPGIHASLDTLVKGIVTEVNGIHTASRTLTGATGVPFFKPTGLTSAGMAVSDEVLRSTDNIAAGQSGGAGDNAAALAIASLRTSGVASFGGNTIGQAYQLVVSDLGVMLNAATQHQTAQEVVVNQADSLRKSISGVSIDEEMTNLISQQNAYAAAARLVNVADQMMQDVIAMVR